MLDNSSLLIGIAFSSASLMLALLIGWLNSRQERYLVHGAAGVGLVMIGVAILGLRADRFDVFVTLLPYALILSGFALIYSGSRLFHRPTPSPVVPLLAGIAALVCLTIPFIFGYTGLGTIALNLAASVLMLLCGFEYWVGRREGRIAMIANAVIYAVIASSFLACAAVLLWQQAWIINAPADNWAEDFNSIMSIVGLTGIGAITLTLHHSRAARRHREEANTDALTGVLNRRALFERFGERDICSGLPVIMFDLDRFKLINDRLGHAQGDMVLQKFVAVLRDNLRHEDVIARLGGEEFCVILPGLDGEKSRIAAENARKAFADLQIPIDAEGDIATVSAGLAVAGSEETFSSALRRADAALYKAKSGGRNQVHMAALRLVA
ncbi:MAG: hypothetical protein ABS75_32600 [Pelagibacterium sp. SCN 63-23]|nr:MAG: hypothetical protein ABS75_32600 [Pelagibacterium sp. SCN 63-23]